PATSQTARPRRQPTWDILALTSPCRADADIAGEMMVFSLANVAYRVGCGKCGARYQRGSLSAGEAPASVTADAASLLEDPTIARRRACASARCAAPPTSAGAARADWRAPSAPPA